MLSHEGHDQQTLHRAMNKKKEVEESSRAANREALNLERTRKLHMLLGGRSGRIQLAKDPVTGEHIQVSLRFKEGCISLGLNWNGRDLRKWANDFIKY